MSGTKRLSITLSVAQVDDLDFIAHKLSMSRSALISTLLNESLPALRQIASAISDTADNATEQDARRLRGASARVIGDQIAGLLDPQGDLYDD